MAYYFMLEKKRGQYEALNIESIYANCQKKRYSKVGAYTLEELDMFTMQFNDELELRKMLLSKNVLTMDLIDKPLSIRTLTKGEYNKVPYDFLYQKDIELIVDPSKLIELILKRYYNNDFVFIKKFAEHFANYYECSTTAPEVCRYADMAIRDCGLRKYLEERDKNGDIMVVRLVKLLLFSYYEQSNGYINYENKIKYRNLHMMIAFINNYNIKNGLEEPKKKIEVSDFIDFQDCMQELIANPKVRKRTKKSEVLDGQLSIFDMLDDDKRS